MAEAAETSTEGAETLIRLMSNAHDPDQIDVMTISPPGRPTVWASFPRDALYYGMEPERACEEVYHALKGGGVVDCVILTVDEWKALKATNE